MVNGILTSLITFPLQVIAWLLPQFTYNRTANTNSIKGGLSFTSYWLPHYIEIWIRPPQWILFWNVYLCSVEHKFVQGAFIEAHNFTLPFSFKLNWSRVIRNYFLLSVCQSVPCITGLYKPYGLFYPYAIQPCQLHIQSFHNAKLNFKCVHCM